MTSDLQLQTVPASDQLAEYGPISLVVLQGTSLCNLNCDYCYLPGRQVKNQISLDLIDPIFQQIFTSPFLKRRFTICWHAGEPLTVSPQFYQLAFEAIDRASQQYNTQQIKYSYSIQTNGTLINQQWCDFIQQHRIRVGVSLDGPQFIHDAHRKNWQGNGTYANTMRGISLLKQNNIDFHVIAVLTQQALEHPDEMFQFFVEQDIKRIGFNVEEIEGMNRSSSLGSSQSEETYRQFMQRFWQLNKAANGILKVREFDRICNIISTDQKLTRSDLVTPFAIISIDHQGNFSTFSPELLAMEGDGTYDNFILGNVLQDSFASVCATEKFQRMYNEIRSGVAQCQQTCQYYGICGGGAPSNKYWENHSFCSTETQFCRLNKQMTTDLVLADLEAALGLR